MYRHILCRRRATHADAAVVVIVVVVVALFVLVLFLLLVFLLLVLLPRATARCRGSLGYTMKISPSPVIHSVRPRRAPHRTPRQTPLRRSLPLSRNLLQLFTNPLLKVPKRLPRASPRPLALAPAPARPHRSRLAHCVLKIPSSCVLRLPL